LRISRNPGSTCDQEDREMEGMREPPVVFPKECSELTEGRRRGWGRARIGNALRRERATASLPLVMGVFRRWRVLFVASIMIAGVERPRRKR